MNEGSLAPAHDGAETRQLLRQSLETVLVRHYSFDQRREAHGSAARHSAEAWRAYAELGLLAVGLPGEHGGLPGELADLAMVAEAMGGALTLEPYRASTVAARLLAAAGTAQQKAAWLPALADGTCKAALAHSEQGAGSFDPICTTSVRTRAGWRINGSKPVVAGGDTADVFVVSARTGGEVGLFLVPAEIIERRAYGCFDWTGAADLVLTDIAVPENARLAGGVDALLEALDEAIVLACADAVGAIRQANALTREYARTRRQFGVPIGSFQVLQHRMVDMAIAEEAAGAITGKAIEMCAQADIAMRCRSVSAAKVSVGNSARFVAQQCLHIHGGMGLSEEYPASHYFARLGLFERAFGSQEEHVNRVALSGQEMSPHD